jgi:hypothetical protein
MVNLRSASEKEDSPEPPRLSSIPSRLEGQADDATVLPGCCKVIAEA